MRRLNSTSIIMMMGLLMLSVQSVAETGSNGQDTAAPIITFTSMYEAHSDQNNPDDYVYNVVSVTQHLEGGVLGSVFYMHKHNLETEDDGGQAVGANVVKMFSSRTYALVGLMYSINEADSTIGSRTDGDRIRVGLFHKAYESGERNYLMVNIVYNTQTDWSEDRTLDLGVSYRHQLSDHWLAEVGYKYTHVLGSLDIHFNDQWDANLTYKLNDTTDLNIGYLLVDKMYTGPVTTVIPEDDNVFRTSLRYRFK